MGRRVHFSDSVPNVVVVMCKFPHSRATASIWSTPSGVRALQIRTYKNSDQNDIQVLEYSIIAHHHHFISL